MIRFFCFLLLSTWLMVTATLANQPETQYVVPNQLVLSDDFSKDLPREAPTWFVRKSTWALKNGTYCGDAGDRGARSAFLRLKGVQDGGVLPHDYVLKFSFKVDDAPADKIKSSTKKRKFDADPKISVGNRFSFGHYKARFQWGGKIRGQGFLLGIQHGDARRDLDFKIKKRHWYHVTCEVRDDQILVRFADGPAYFMQHPVFREAKGWEIFGGQGEVVFLDNLEVWDLIDGEQKGWADAKKKLLKYKNRSFVASENPEFSTEKPVKPTERPKKKEAAKKKDDTVKKPFQMVGDLSKDVGSEAILSESAPSNFTTRSFSKIQSDGIDLVFLTGDEQMRDLNENVSLRPTLIEELGESVLVIKAAQMKKHMGHWAREWKGLSRNKEMVDSFQGWFFDKLIREARAQVGDKKVKSITLVWMHGMRDARLGYTSTYAAGFKEVVDQFKKEFARDDINCVLGRLGANTGPQKFPEWEAIKGIQQELGESLPRTDWVDTDGFDLSSARRSSKYSQDLGKAFAESVVKLIRKHQGSKDSIAAVLPPRKIPQKRPAAHLFLMSGQSNMAGVDLNKIFIPTMEAEFGKDEWIVVKAAYGAQSIGNWYDWKSKSRLMQNESSRRAPSAVEKEHSTHGFRHWIYKEMMGKIRSAVADRDIKSITLCWMQGESDAVRHDSADVYADNFNQLLSFLREDLGRNDVNFVIGRLSDHSRPEKYVAWERMRQIQMALANDTKRGEWIDTDSYNGEKNALHYTDKAGLMKAFAKQAIALARLAEREVMDDAPKDQ